MTDYLNTKHDLNSEELFSFVDELPLWSAPFGLKLLDIINYRKNIIALDIGSGGGFPLTEIAMRLGETCSVYGLDPFEPAINRAKKKTEFYGIRNVEIIKGVAENIPLDSGSVDLVTSNNGINNVESIDKSLSECNRIMKRGAQFVMSVNLNETMTEYYQVMEKTLKEYKMDREILKMHEHIFEKRKPKLEYTKILEKHDFKIKNTINDSFNYCFSDGTSMFRHFFINLAFLSSWKKIVPKKDLNKIFGKIELKLNEIATKNGSIKLSVPFIVFDCVKP